MPSINHVHTYQRVKGNKKMYRCTDKYCSHVQKKELLLGKACICNICHKNEFTLTSADLQRMSPRCIDCSSTKEARELKERMKILENLGIGMDSQSDPN